MKDTPIHQMADAIRSAAEVGLRNSRGKYVMTEFGITRRRMLRTVAMVGGLAAVTASGNKLGTARAQSARKTFVLVHGTSCGSWT